MDQPISQLPIATALTGNEATVVVQQGVTKQTSVSQIANAISPGKLIVSSQLSGSNLVFNYSDGTNSNVGPVVATATAGTTTTLAPGSSATVTNVGTTQNAIFNFGIPQGAGIPTGGITGQVLSKLSDTDYDTTWTTVSGTGTVTSVTGVLPISVATGTTTPVISMPAATTSVNGYLTSTDWTTFNSKAPATSGTSILYGNGSGGFSNVTIGSGLTFSTGTLSATGGGTGDVVGPASATDNAITRFDGTTGKLIQDSTVTIDDTGNMSGVNSIITPDYITFDTTAAATSATGKLFWDDGEGVLSNGLKGGNVTLQIGTQEYARVYNDQGSTITKGQVVYISGAQGNRVAVKLARADVEATSFGTIGIVAESIANGAEGYIIVSGALYKLNTTSLTAGASVYLSPTTAGAITTTKPQAPDQLVVLGWVERVDATVGSIYVKVDNGYELDELHDVQVTSPTSGNLLIYDASTTPIGVWKNANLTAGTGISVSNGAGSITVTNSAPDQTVAISGTSPISVTGTYPNFTVSMTQSGTSTNGWLSSTDWNTFNSKQPAGTYVTSVGATSPVTSTGGTTPTIAMPAATTSVSGYLTSTDWNTFNGKQAALVSGTNIKTVNGTTLLGSGDLGTIGSGYGGTGFSTYATGDLIYASATNTLSKLAAGTNGYVLTLSGGVPTWAAGGGSMVYPGAGIAVSTGSAWGTSLTAPSGTIVGTSDTQTLTNKRVNPRVSTTTSSATPTINTDNVDMYGLTAQTVDITSFTTNLSGTPVNGQKLWIYIVGTAARAITWGASFEASTVALPTTTVSTNRLDVGFVWNSVSSKWRCVAVA